MSALDVFNNFQAAFDAALPPDRPVYVEPSAEQIDAKARALQAEWMRDDDKLYELLLDGSWNIPTWAIAAALRAGDERALGALMMDTFRRELEALSKNLATDELAGNA